MTNKERLFTLICVVILTILGVGCGTPESFDPNAATPHCSFDTIEGKGYLIICADGIYQCMDHDDKIIESGCYFEDFNKTHRFNCIESCK